MEEFTTLTDIEEYIEGVFSDDFDEYDDEFEESFEEFLHKVEQTVGDQKTHGVQKEK